MHKTFELVENNDESVAVNPVITKVALGVDTETDNEAWVTCKIFPTPLPLKLTPLGTVIVPDPALFVIVPTFKVQSAIMLLLIYIHKPKLFYLRKLF